jgi:DnaK suppressor protein
MTHEFRTKLIQQLEERREKLLKTIRSWNGQPQDGALGQEGDEVDLANRRIVDNVDGRVVKICQQMVDQIDETIKQVKAGIYGDCRNCGDPIEERRLKALPFARRCISCELGHSSES